MVLLKDGSVSMYSQSLLSVISERRDNTYKEYGEGELWQFIR